jgi:hypothetical protein
MKTKSIRNPLTFAVCIVFERPSARQRRLDRETDAAVEVFLNPADDFATAGDCGAARIGRIQPARDRVGVKQIFASRKIQHTGDCAFALSIRSGDDGQNRQLVRQRYALIRG